MSEFVIYKYEVYPSSSPHEIWLPHGSQVLTIQQQRDKPVMWVLQPLTEAKKVCRWFRLLETGRKVELPDGKKLVYIGTVQSTDGYTVGHLFEEVNW